MKNKILEILNKYSHYDSNPSYSQISGTKFQLISDEIVKLFAIPVVSGWLELYENEELFNEMAKKNCPCRYDDGTQGRYNDNQPLAMITHFKLV